MTTGRINQVAAFQARRGRPHGGSPTVSPSVFDRQDDDPKVEAWQTHVEGAMCIAVPRPPEGGRDSPVRPSDRFLEQPLEPDDRACSGFFVSRGALRAYVRPASSFDLDGEPVEGGRVRAPCGDTYASLSVPNRYRFRLHSIELSEEFL